MYIFKLIISITSLKKWKEEQYYFLVYFALNKMLILDLHSVKCINLNVKSHVSLKNKGKMKPTNSLLKYLPIIIL